MQQQLDRVHVLMFARLLMFSDMRTFADLDGRRIALYRGFDRPPAGAPVVVLPGAGLVGLDFLSIATGDTVLYDRAGTGWSSPVPLPRPAADVAVELRDSLLAAGVPGPWILVGHSMGALYARRFAQLFPSSVRGMLLLDPGHEDLFDYLPPAAAELNAALKPDPAQLPDLTAAQLAAARDAYARLLAAWPAAVREELTDHHLTHWRTSLYETANLESAVYPEVRAGGPVPDVPTTVLTAGAGNPAWAGVGDPVLIQQALDGIRRLHETMAAESSRGRHLVIDDATHQYLHIEHPAAVSAALLELIG
jgi:pimeloyl-ACP methyl ester carboxylesterase